MPIIASKTLYWNSDKSRVVGEDDPDAAFLLARAGTAVDDATATQFKLGGDAPEGYDAVADHAAKHGGETPEQAQARRQAMLDGVPDADGAPVAGERDDVKAQDAPAATKAKSRAPETK